MVRALSHFSKKLTTSMPHMVPTPTGRANSSVFEEEPSIAVAAGDASTAFEMANKNMSGRGRGRLMVRELCDGIERNRYMDMNETIYHIPLFGKSQEQGQSETKAGENA